MPLVSVLEAGALRRWLPAAALPVVGMLGADRRQSSRTFRAAQRSICFGERRPNLSLRAAWSIVPGPPELQKSIVLGYEGLS